MKKISVILLMILLALLTYLSINRTDFRNLGKSNQPSIIKITDKGFEPAELTVPIGTSINFINNDKEAHWPASNPHPTHDLYPEFDPQRPIDPNKTWTFKFTKAGSWPYHDHLNPILRGKIVVTKTKFSSNDLQPSNTKLILPKNEITDKIKEVAATEGSVTAWKYFKDNYLNSNLNGSHDIAHYIGSLIYEEKGIEGLKECDASFAFGCYHGILEELIARQGVKNLSLVVEECKTLPSQSSITCYHGIGHGILPYFKYDLTKTLPFCDSILSSENQIFCYNGVFMENAIVNSSKATKDNPHWPCNVVEEKYKAACYGYQMVFLFSLYKDNIAKISKICQEAGKNDYTENCIRGLAQQITQSSSYNVDSIKDNCKLVGSDLAYKCQIAAAEEFVFQKQPFEIAKNELCSPLPQTWSKECLNKIEVQRSIQ